MRASLCAVGGVALRWNPGGRALVLRADVCVAGLADVAGARGVHLCDTPAGKPSGAANAFGVCLLAGVGSRRLPCLRKGRTLDRSVRPLAMSEVWLALPESIDPIFVIALLYVALVATVSLTAVRTKSPTRRKAALEVLRLLLLARGSQD